MRAEVCALSVVAYGVSIPPPQFQTTPPQPTPPLHHFNICQCQEHWKKPTSLLYEGMNFLRNLWGNFLVSDIHIRCKGKLFINVTTFDEKTGNVESKFMSKFGTARGTQHATPIAPSPSPLYSGAHLWSFYYPQPIPILNLDSRAHLIELLLGAKAIPGFTLVDDVYHAVESCGSKMILDGAFTHMAPPLASNTGERTSL